MKKNLLLYTALLLLAISVFNSCKKSDFDSNYYNPEKSVTADVPRLYAGLFKDERVMPRYFNLYTFHIPVLGTYSQTSGYTNGKGVYEQPTNYAGSRWDYFFTHDIASFREIEKHYNMLSETEKEGFQLFLETSKIYIYDLATQIVDMWGDMPFSEAGGLASTGSIILAKYDKQEDVYTEALTELKRISDYLRTATPSDFYATQFRAYDYVNNGDIKKWRRYCNSLILRLAMRISYKDETTAKTAVQGILGDTTNYPIINKAAESAVIQANSATSTLLPSDKNEVRNGFGVNPFAPGKMLNEIMAPTSDPRLPVYFTQKSGGGYNGITNTLTEAEVTIGIAANNFSRWDSTTFTENYLLPGILITAAEVQFIKAEAYERWGGGDAKEAYEKGIRESISFWYAVNHNTAYTAGRQEPVPTEAEIAAYLAKPSIAYGSDNLNKVATQKWIDFNIMEAHQAWAEYRRTKLPVLSFPIDGSSSISPNVPNRLLYPDSERSYNTANYKAVQGKDNVTTKIFWDVK
ncbi:MAG: SusD/RagB family nutrient-binding outer membrane lipoprotein [Niabella sp.]